MVLQTDVQVALGSVAERGQKKSSKIRYDNAGPGAGSLNSINITVAWDPVRTWLQSLTLSKGSVQNPATSLTKALHHLLPLFLLCVF